MSVVKIEGAGYLTLLLTVGTLGYVSWCAFWFVVSLIYEHVWFVLFFVSCLGAALLKFFTSPTWPWDESNFKWILIDIGRRDESTVKLPEVVSVTCTSFDPKTGELGPEKVIWSADSQCDESKATITPVTETPGRVDATKLATAASKIDEQAAKMIREVDELKQQEKTRLVAERFNERVKRLVDIEQAFSDKYGSLSPERTADAEKVQEIECDELDTRTRSAERASKIEQAAKDARELRDILSEGSSQMTDEEVLEKSALVTKLIKSIDQDAE